jgi:hypothetical protein
VGATSNNQDLLFNNASSAQTFNSPTGAQIASKTDVSANVTLANGSTYTEEFIVKLAGTGPNTVMVSNIFYSGAGTGGTVLFQSGSLATAANTLTTTFDGLAVGWRQNNPAAPVSTMDILSINIANGVVVVPEPSTLALAGCGLGLMLAVIRRRRS